MPKEHPITASTRLRKLIHHDIRESDACYEGIISYFCTLNHIQNAHTAQEKHSYAMSKISSFSMQSLSKFYLQKKIKERRGEPRENFKLVRQF